MEGATKTNPIVWAPQETGQGDADGDEARHRRRAERFGTDFVEPKSELAAGVAREQPQKQQQQKQQQQQQANQKQKQKLKRSHAFNERRAPAIVTGIDIYSEEELAKRESRAAKFGVSAATPVYAPLEQPMDEDERKKADRAARFGTQYQAPDQTGLRNADVLEERRDFGAAVERRPEAIYLYGVDRLSTREVLAYFGDYGPAAAEWIDDSSCVVVFGDAASAKRAIVGRGRPLGPGEAPDLQGLDPGDLKNLPFLWHRGPDFEKAGPGAAPVPLIYRMATVEDRKGMAPTKASRFLWLPQGKKPGTVGRKRGAPRDADGDVAMGDAAAEGGAGGSRAAKRARRRARRAGLDAQMADAEGAEAGAGGGPRVVPPAQPPPEPQDPEELRAARARQKAEGPSGLFSAADAGILPSFLMPPAAAGNEAAAAAEPAAENGDSGGGMEAED